MLSHFIVSNSATLWTVARQPPLSMGFSRQEYCSGLLCSPPGDLPDPRMETWSLMSRTWQAGSLPLAPPGKHSNNCSERVNRLSWLCIFVCVCVLVAQKC